MIYKATLKTITSKFLDPEVEKFRGEKIIIIKGWLAWGGNIGGAQENSISELKTSFAFDHIPTNTYQANSVYMQMSQMAYNLSISMQHSMGISTDRDTKGKSTRRFKSMKWKTFRFMILNRACRIAWRNGKKVIELTKNNETELLYRNISTNLNQIEFKKAA